MEHPPFKHRRTTLERAEKFISDVYFADANLYSKLYTEKSPVADLKHFKANDRIPYSQAIKGKFQPTSVGKSFGPVWSTHWFQVKIKIPPHWQSQEVHFLWDSNSEALVWMDDKPVQGLNHAYRKNYLKLEGNKTEFELYVEMACNNMFGIGSLALSSESDNDKTFQLSQCEIGLLNRDVFELMLDVEILHDIAKEMPEASRGYQALHTVNNMINSIDVNEKSTFKRAREMAKAFFSQKNGETQHTLYAMGHAHIDSAWLWPYAESIRKCARSWSCTLRLMEKSPHFIFVCSQAQQFAWVKEHYPNMWKEICKFVERGQFVPVGGTWVEMDGNIPSGEACIRQFLLGQKFFMEEFGMQCKEFWLPDTFGYSAQFPQILQHCGITRFLTQKLSWSLVNKFPHHTFFWEGIDGSAVLAHFPPGDSYEMQGKVHELLKSGNNFKDKGRSNVSAFLYGDGDGGHGPSDKILGRLERLQDCDGLPKVKFSDSNEFFSYIEKESPKMLCRWRGELYLELHNGTYTTWGKVKKGNRKCEILLQDAEFACTMAALKTTAFIYPRKELERLWKLLLLNQFHDVLPGSSITQVYDDAIAYYEEIKKFGAELLSSALSVLTGSEATGDTQTFVVNTQGFPRTEVLCLKESESYGPASKRRKLKEGAYEEHTVQVHVPPMSVLPLSMCTIDHASTDDKDSTLSVMREDDLFVLSNGLVKASIDPLGRVVSLMCFDKESSRWSKEAVDAEHPCNQFLIYDDIPLYWDAWDVMDYHLETRKPVINPIERVRTFDSNNLSCSLQMSLKVSDSSYIKQEIVLEKGSPYLRFNTEVTWGENHKFLKVEFPTTVHTTEAAYDIQSGFLRRPNHFNTSWDSARFEVCGHKWADLSEYGFGVSILNDCKYGYSAVDGILRLSLLRSPKNPDPKADMGVHTFSYAIMPHFGSLQEAQVIQHALAFNCSLKTFAGPTTYKPIAREVQGLFELSSPQAVLQTVKMAEDGTNTVILRLNEAFGGHKQISVNCRLPLKKAEACSGLEEVLPDEDSLKVTLTKGNEGCCQISLNLSPFQIVSLRCSV